jgi:hypothetical protein
MKILTAFVTVLALVGFTGASFACDSATRTKQETAQNKDAPLLPKDQAS